MKLKRKFLSRKNKTVISVWNKGKKDKNGNTRDGKNPPWSIFENEKEVIVKRENIDSMKFNDKSIEIGFISILS